MIKNYLLHFLLFIVGNSIAQTINFSDSNFKSLLLSASTTPTNNSHAYDEHDNSLIIDQNGDGEIQVYEAEKVFILRMNCGGCYDERKISSIDGIEYFSNLRELNLSENLIESVNLTSLRYLVTLLICNNKLKNFDFTGLDNLESFNGCGNLFEELDFSTLKKIRQINCTDNKLVNVNVSGLENLQELAVQNNSLSSLNISHLSNLNVFYGSNNKIVKLETKGLFNITDFRCENNLISSLNFSDSNKLSNVICSNNKLEYLSLKNGHFDDYVQFEGNPDLKFVCTDDILNVNNYSEEDAIKLSLKSYKNDNCSVNSYCTFTPGGSTYTIIGTSKYDLDGNGCDTSDINFKNLKYNITDGINKGNIISDASGNYSIAVGSGTHTITPVLPNPSYYNISPSSLVVNFPSEVSPFVQNFCITPKGIHQDLEITLLPTIPARPGFDATYKILYKNNGTATQSGSVNLSFNDAVLDYNSSLPIVSNHIIDKLTWDYINLKPFESREIDVIFNVNSPMETPAVNIGDRLSFNALITPVNGDEKPVDNSFALRQEVVGSFDPNDKTCLEGDIITPSLIGEYVHYLIHFENTGTYQAENIVVKDVIDLSKFDLSTLVPTKASHDFVSKISDGNKVEFIFEKINLPFDDALNDGYIAFKIKTLPTLKVGDTFENEANIYFDYNFPILTNKAVSTFKTLGNQDFEFSEYFNVYPNPVNDILNFGIKNSIEVKSISFYDVLGQLIIAVPNAQKVSKIDVSKLSSGNYILKMNTNKGVTTVKFIKK